jgi:hypothetical protein
VDAPYDFVGQAKTGASTVPPPTGIAVLSSRERPTIFTDPVSGTPVALINGVSDLGYNRQAKGRDWAWTLVNPVLA